MVRAAIVVIALVLGAAPAATAMPLAAKERTDQVGQWIGYSAVCDRLGYRVTPGYMTSDHGKAMEDAAVADLVALGAVESDARRELDASISRNIVLFKADLDAVSAPTGKAGLFRPQVTAIFGKLDAECLRLSRDPIFAPYIAPLPEPERIAKRVEAEDAILELNGEASWQGPKAQVRGDLFYTVGLCRRFLNDQELSAYRARLDQDGARAKAFYEGQWSDGINRAAEVNLDKTQCERALASIGAKAK